MDIALTNIYMKSCISQSVFIVDFV